jgi:hypothetical protein
MILFPIAVWFVLSSGVKVAWGCDG